MKSTLLLLVVLIAVSPTVFGATSLQEQIFMARDKVMPAVVHIQPVVTNYFTGELEKQSVVGSGVIFHPDGYVVTNYHVAGKAERIICTMYDREQVTAEFVGGDPMTDLAVIKLNLEEYHGVVPVAEFGNSDSVQVGQYVLAMGSPLSLSRSVSAGVISTKDRYFSADVRLPTGERTGRYNLWIQTDAAINPGNSGGPLVDLEGRVVGINSRATLFANNIGFAIPVNIVRNVTQALMADGVVTRSWIGLHCQAMQEMEKYFGTDRNSGVLIASVDPGSPADEAFLKAGDVILQMDSVPVSARFVEELPAFYNRIASHKPGDQVLLEVLRGDQKYHFSVTTRQLGELQGDDFEAKGWGFAVKAITRQMALEYQLDDTAGVFVVGVKRMSSADEGGLSRGDVILRINNEIIGNLEQFETLYEEYRANTTPRLLMTVKQGGATRFILVKTEEEEEGEQTNE
ncbi:MAG TPA: trypsin-like peptidase domain-containing protein [candidate division Zixibacteria bacterium]|nr:trypsin-like peptidase domain-containing protein [candidate division Zixibacteria bacterium]